MNNDHITQQLRRALENAGLEVGRQTHLSSLRVEFHTTPPLTWTFAQCDQATAEIYNATISGHRLGDVFSTNHDRTHGFWDFRLEDYSLDGELDSPAHAQS